VTRGPITLGAVSAHTTMLVVGCIRCDRSVRYSLDMLIERHGRGCGIPDLLRRLSKDCPKYASAIASHLCGIHCPELPGFFLPTAD
jgi:hypothetical protein